jgi:serine/threonine protein kinase
LFIGKNQQEVLSKNIRCLAEFPEAKWHGISNDAKNLVQLMLNADPKCRPHAKECMGHKWIRDSDKLQNVPLGIAKSLMKYEMAMKNSTNKSPIESVDEGFSVNAPVIPGKGIQMYCMSPRLIHNNQEAIVDDFIPKTPKIQPFLKSPVTVPHRVCAMTYMSKLLNRPPLKKLDRDDFQLDIDEKGPSKR